jgi:UDP-glucose 4-epimerase
MKNLVTGGAGILAATPARRSVPRGSTPVVYDNLSRGHGWGGEMGARLSVATSPTVAAN